MLFYNTLPTVFSCAILFYTNHIHTQLCTNRCCWKFFELCCVCVYVAFGLNGLLFAENPCGFFWIIAINVLLASYWCNVYMKMNCPLMLSINMSVNLIISFNYCLSFFKGIHNTVSIDWTIRSVSAHHIILLLFSMQFSENYCKQLILICLLICLIFLLPNMRAPKLMTTTIHKQFSNSWLPEV